MLARKYNDFDAKQNKKLFAIALYNLHYLYEKQNPFEIQSFKEKK